MKNCYRTGFLECFDSYNSLKSYAFIVTLGIGRRLTDLELATKEKERVSINTFKNSRGDI